MALQRQGWGRTRRADEWLGSASAMLSFDTHRLSTGLLREMQRTVVQSKGRGVQREETQSERRRQPKQFSRGVARMRKIRRSPSFGVSPGSPHDRRIAGWLPVRAGISRPLRCQAGTPDAPIIIDKEDMRLDKAYCPICGTNRFLKKTTRRQSVNGTYVARCGNCCQFFRQSELYWKPYVGKHERRQKNYALRLPVP